MEVGVGKENGPKTKSNVKQPKKEEKKKKKVTCGTTLVNAG
jgi:hypothetical protein